MGAQAVYIHPLPAPSGRGTGPGAAYPVIPVGLVGHVNLLREAGVHVQGVNLGVERMLDPDFQLSAWLRQRAEPALVLVDMHWYEHVWGALVVAETVRAAWPHTRIVLGGLSATHFYAAVLERCAAVDAVVCGPAEDAVLQLAHQAVGGTWAPLDVANVASRDGLGVVCRSEQRWLTPPDLLDRLDSVDLTWLEHAAAYRRMLHSRPRRVNDRNAQGQWILSGRGCAYACGYCGGGRHAHRVLSGLTRVARRDPVRLAADVNRLTRLGVEQVAPSLDPDMHGRTHRTAFFDGLEGLPGLYVESYQLPSDDLLVRLAGATHLDHTEVALTPLSGNTAVRRLHGKRYDNVQLVDTVRRTAELGVAVFAFFSLNLPGEDEQTVQETVALVRRLLEVAPADGFRAISICHTIDPLSPMSESPGAFGVDWVGLRTLDDYVSYAQSSRPFTFAPGERGFTLKTPRNLPAMVAAWDALAAEHPGRVYPVPRV